MSSDSLKGLDVLLETLGLSEEPMGIGFSATCPEGCMQPRPGTLPTREMEAEGKLDWSALMETFSCAIGHIWRARKKRTVACFSAERFGCLGAAFWMGFSGPSTEAQIQYVSMDERYLNTCEDMRRVMDQVEPEPVPEKYLIVQPVSMFTEEPPLVVTFFTRPESLAGLHQLAAFLTGDPEVVASPWAAGCGSIVAWPLYYLQKGETRAVIGGWDPSARKYYKTDELTFTVPFAFFKDMLARWETSFLARPVWSVTKKKAERSARAWGE